MIHLRTSEANNLQRLVKGNKSWVRCPWLPLGELGQLYQPWTQEISLWATKSTVVWSHFWSVMISYGLFCDGGSEDVAGTSEPLVRHFSWCRQGGTSWCRSSLCMHDFLAKRPAMIDLVLCNFAPHWDKDRRNNVLLPKRIRRQICPVRSRGECVRE